MSRWIALLEKLGIQNITYLWRYCVQLDNPACMGLTEWSTIHGDITSMHKCDTDLGSNQPNRPMGRRAGPREILVMIELLKESWGRRRGVGIIGYSPKEMCGPSSPARGIEGMAEWQVLSMFGWLD